MVLFARRRHIIQPRPESEDPDDAFTACHCGRTPMRACHRADAAEFDSDFGFFRFGDRREQACSEQESPHPSWHQAVPIGLAATIFAAAQLSNMMTIQHYI